MLLVVTSCVDTLKTATIFWQFSVCLPSLGVACIRGCYDSNLLIPYEEISINACEIKQETFCFIVGIHRQADRLTSRYLQSYVPVWCI